jgi:hypothetical protein
MSWRSYDPAKPWAVGQQVVFATDDSDDADTREMSGTTATVLEIAEDGETIRVDCDYGPGWYDPYSFVVRA